VRQALIASLLLLSGCSVGPSYQPPKAAAPTAYKQSVPESFRADEGWKAAQPQDHIDRKRWWEVFQDPLLSELVPQVQDNNQNLAASEARLRQVRSMIRVNRASRMPNVTTSPGVGGLRLSNNRPGFPANLRAEASPNLTWPVDFSYEVDLWGRVRKSIEAARIDTQASDADMQTARLSLQSELAFHYFEVRMAEAQQDLLERTVTTFEDALRITTNRFEGGVAPKMDVTQAKAQLESARADLIDISIHRAQHEHAIAVLIGKAPVEFTLASTDRPMPQPPVIPVGLPSELLERRPDVAAGERRAAAANERIGLAKTAFYPTIRIGGGGGFTGTSVMNWFTWPSHLWSLGSSAALPVFDAGRRRALTDGAVADFDATVAEYKQTTLAAFQEVEDSLVELRVLEAEEAQQRQAVEAARESVELATNRYQGGIDTYIQVLNAQTVALLSERKTLDIRRRRMAASVALIKALGGGWDVSELPKPKT